MKLFVVLALSVAHVYCRDAITVDPAEGGSLTDLSGTGLTRKYCVVDGSTLSSAGVIEANYCGTAFQCTTRCNQRKDCLSFFFTGNRVCQLLDGRGTPGTKVKGTYFYRLKEDESCPEGSSPYAPPDGAYSNTYCMIWDYKCPGDGFYKKPQSIPTMLDCLQKCSKIKECGMVNYDSVNKKCEPLISEPCPDANLVDAPKFQNFVRLAAGETECSPNRKPPSPVHPPPTEPPPEPTEEPEVPEPKPGPSTANCGGKKYVARVWNNGKTTVTAECGPGCKMSVCHCLPYGRCDGARFTSDGKCRADYRTGGAWDRRSVKRFRAHIKCVPGTSMDVTYVSTQTPGQQLRCGDGYRLGDCAWFAFRRDRFTTGRWAGRRSKGYGCGVPLGRSRKGCLEVGRCLSTAVCYKKT